MRKIISFFIGITCNCREPIAPFLNKEVKVKWPSGCGSWTGIKCKCGRVWMREDGYWTPLTEALMEEFDEMNKRVELITKEKVPDLSKWGI